MAVGIDMASQLTKQEWGRFWDRVEREERNRELVADYLRMRQGYEGPRSLRELAELYGLTVNNMVEILKKHGVYKVSFLHFGADA